MSRLVAALATLTCAAIVTRTVLRGEHLAYVKPSLTIPLLLAAAVLFVVGGSQWWRAWRGLRPRGTAYDGPRRTLSGSDDDEDAHDRHSHHRHGQDRHPGRRSRPPGRHRHRAGQVAPPIGWALVVPFLVLATVPPTPVGSYSAARSADNADARVVWGEPATYAPLPGTAVVDLTIRQFWERASFDTQRSLAGRRVRLVGFATPDRAADGDGWALTRMAILCCAADAFPVKVLPLGGSAPAEGRWVAVEGIWRPDPDAPAPTDPDAGGRLPRLEVVSLTPVAQPATPYE